MLGSFVCLYVFLFVCFVLFCFFRFLSKDTSKFTTRLRQIPQIFHMQSDKCFLLFLPFHLVENTVSTHEDEKVKESLPFEDPVCITLEYFRSV